MKLKNWTFVSFFNSHVEYEDAAIKYKRFTAHVGFLGLTAVGTQTTPDACCFKKY